MRANVEDRGMKGDCTPLMEAASAGHADIVKLLIGHCADVNAQSSSGETAAMCFFVVYFDINFTQQATRLGKFPQFGILFTLGNVLKIAYVIQIFRPVFLQKKFWANLSQKRLV
jgi:hypothetical protein